MHIGPEIGNTVEITVAVAIDQPGALPADNNRMCAVLPLLHLGERVPDKVSVVLLQKCRTQVIHNRSPAAGYVLPAGRRASRPERPPLLFHQRSRFWGIARVAEPR